MSLNNGDFKPGSVCMLLYIYNGRDLVGSHLYFHLHQNTFYADPSLSTVEVRGQPEVLPQASVTPANVIQHRRPLHLFKL
jgi:hypothetical protein